MNIQSIGSVAAELLEQSHTAVVQGSTRTGVFLRLDSGWVIFLSREAEHGPLTLNMVVDEADNLSSLEVGAQLEVVTPDTYPNKAFIAHPPPKLGGDLPGSGRLLGNALTDNKEGELLLEIDLTQVWLAPPRPADALPGAQRRRAAAEAVKQAQRIRPTASLTAFQAVLDGDMHAPQAEAGHFFPHLARIKDQLAGRQRSTIESFTSPLRQLDPHSLSALLGLGRGLTPSGDDILIGMLLALYRWRSVLARGLDISLLNRNVLAQAYQRTTTISANLMECAARGQADERLITALDILMTGSDDPTQAAGLLSGWGSSSGLDALCGMALILVGSQG